MGEAMGLGAGVTGARVGCRGFKRLIASSQQRLGGPRLEDEAAAESQARRGLPLRARRVPVRGLRYEYARRGADDGACAQVMGAGVQIQYVGA